MRNFNFIIKQQGYILKRLDDWTYNIESQNVRILLFVEKQITLTVALEPIGEAAKLLLQQNVVPRALEVIVVCMCLDPELKYKIQRIEREGIANNIPLELEKRAGLMKQYCRDILDGNFSAWIAIEHCVQKRAYEFLEI